MRLLSLLALPASVSAATCMAHVFTAAHLETKECKAWGAKTDERDLQPAETPTVAAGFAREELLHLKITMPDGSVYQLQRKPEDPGIKTDTVHVHSGEPHYEKIEVLEMDGDKPKDGGKKKCVNVVAKEYNELVQFVVPDGEGCACAQTTDKQPIYTQVAQPNKEEREVFECLDKDYDAQVEEEQHTRAPTEPPKETTEAPKETTKAPKETTEAPKETTEAPKETTEAPKKTTEAPKETTEAPKATTAAAGGDSTEPESGGGVPTWLWIVIVLALLGGGGFLYAKNQQGQQRDPLIRNDIEMS